jgi:Holliday junction resolvase RusA-like endonuclease
MPKSWSKAKKDEMRGGPHQQTPDKDNLEKAILDSLYENDSHVWDGWVTKLWADEGAIEVEEIGE